MYSRGDGHVLRRIQLHQQCFEYLHTRCRNESAVDEATHPGQGCLDSPFYPAEHVDCHTCMGERDTIVGTEEEN